MEHQERLKKLEEKILKAKELGIQFYLMHPKNPHEGYVSPPSAPHGTLNISQEWSDEGFEKELDVVIKNLKEKNYLKILKDYNLLH